MERTKTTGLHAGRVRFRRGFGLAIALHVAAVFGLALVHPVLRPDADVAAYDVVIMTADPPSAVVEPPQNVSVPEPITSPDQESAPTADTPAIPPPPLEAPQQVAVEPEPPSPPPSTVAETEPPPPPPAPVAKPKPSPEPVIPEPAPLQSPLGPTLRPPRQSSEPARTSSRTPAARDEAASTGRSHAAPILAPKAGEPKTAALPPAAPQPLAPTERASPAWLAGVDKWLLDHRFYPEMARRLGREGTVVVRFTADYDGHVLAVALVRGSGSEVLDEAAQVLVRDARLPRFPPDMPTAQQSVAVSIRYRLN